MAALRIRFLRPPCFSKCKFFFIFSDLKLSMKVIFFSKILNYNIINKYYIIDWYFFAQNSRHLRQIPLLLSNFEIWLSYRIWWRSMTIKTKKTKKNRFLSKSFVTMVFGEKHIFWAKFRSKFIAELYGYTPQTLMDVSWKRRCIPQGDSSNKHDRQCAGWKFCHPIFSDGRIFSSFFLQNGRSELP